MMRTHNKQVLAAAACLSLLLAGCGKASPEEEMMDYLRTAYNDVSLSPMVVSGDVSEADKFAPLVNSEVPFTVKGTEESCTLSEYIGDCKPEEQVTRIIRGKTDQEGNYLLRVREDGNGTEYLVRYVVRGNAKYKRISFDHPEDRRLE